jgi:hypothetical protein
MSAQPGRPTTAQVAKYIRARTKDSTGAEVGDFDGDTRPTDAQCEDQISSSLVLVQTRLPDMSKITDAELLAAVEEVVAMDAACVIEKTYWPEQLGSARSPYAILKAERDEELAALAAAAAGAAGGGTEFEMPGITMIKVGSWTSILPPGGEVPPV